MNRQELAHYVRQVERAADFVAQQLPAADTALVLGSGLGGLVDELEEKSSIPYGEIPHFPKPTVAGHDGELVAGKLAGRQVLAFCGRYHYYEGHPPETVVLPVRLMAALGLETVILTNAAGGIDPAFTPGELMLITDHLNLMGFNPLLGANHEPWGPRFPDLSAAYDPGLQDLARKVAREQGITLREGVYLGNPGPSYETPAEIRMYGQWGAAAVGMSTVPEVIAARHLGLKVLAVSCISNRAAGLSAMPLSHAEVMAAGQAAEADFKRLLRGVVSALGDPA